jgi:hypothetical protein
MIFELFLTLSFLHMNDTYIDKISDLPKPEVHYTGSWGGFGDISGYINISGFRNTTRVNGTDYVRGKPDPVIDSGVSIGELRSKVVLDYRVRCYWCSVLGVSKQLSVVQIGNRTVAYFNITLDWQETVEGSDRSTTLTYRDSATFMDSRPTPEQYPTLDSDTPVFIEKYPEQNEVAVALYPANASEIALQYNESKLTHYLNVYRVDNSSGVYYTNSTAADFYNWDGTNISRIGDTFLINTRNFNLSNLKVTISNPYETVQLTNYSVQMSNDKPATWVIFNPVLFVVLGIFSTFVYSISYLYKSMMRWF